MTGLSLKAKANQEDARRKVDRERAEMQKMRFSMVEEDVVASTSASVADKGKGREKKAKGDRSKSRKKQDDGAWESDEEERSAKRRREDERYAQVDAVEELPEEDEATRIERERQLDAKERDEFSARMKDREKDRTKNKMEDRASTKMDAESVARRALKEDPDSIKEVMPDLRIRSRQSYLNKRESQQLDLLRIEIADDERDFKGVKLTKRERSELDRKKELLRLAEERLAVDEGFDGYVIPEGALLLHNRRC